MIDFKTLRPLLVPLLESKGYVVVKDKSSRSNLVMSNGNNRLILSKKNSDQFDYYFNASCDGDYGDTVAFFKKELFGDSQLQPTRAQYLKLESEISRFTSMAITPSNNYKQSTPKTKSDFNIALYEVSDIVNYKILPKTISYMLNKRGLSVDFNDKDLCESVKIINHKGNENLLFLWRDYEGKVLGAQQKYYSNNKCYKMMLEDSIRGNSIWRTFPQSPTAIFVTEDPLDCLAYREQTQNYNYIYCATGGSITPHQTMLINTLSEVNQIPIIAASDNDIAGAITNYKLLIRDNHHISTNKETGIITVKHHNGDNIFQGDLSKFNDLIDYLVAPTVHKVIRPTAKDWNDQLLDIKQKANASEKQHTTINERESPFL